MLCTGKVYVYASRIRSNQFQLVENFPIIPSTYLSAICRGGVGNTKSTLFSTNWKFAANFHQIEIRCVQFN